MNTQMIVQRLSCHRLCGVIKWSFMQASEGARIGVTQDLCSRGRKLFVRSRRVEVEPALVFSVTQGGKSGNYIEVAYLEVVGRIFL